MGLIACPDCSNHVSDRAVACPKCGAPIADYLKAAGTVIQLNDIKPLKSAIITPQSLPDLPLLLPPESFPQEPDPLPEPPLCAKPYIARNSTITDGTRGEYESKRSINHIFTGAGGHGIVQPKRIFMGGTPWQKQERGDQQQKRGSTGRATVMVIVEAG